MANSIVPTAPSGDSSNRAASTAFVARAVAGAGGITSLGGATGAITLGYGLSVPGNVLSAGITAAQTFLTSNVLLNNTSNYFDVVNTGSIGASGQVWEISVGAYLLDTTANASLVVRIWDGSTVYAETGTTIIGASSDTSVSISAIVTLSGAATFALSCKDRSFTTGIVQATGAAGTANKATYIIAKRLS